MIIKLRRNLSDKETEALLAHLRTLGFSFQPLHGHLHDLIHVSSNLDAFDPISLKTFPCVEDVIAFDNGLRKTMKTATFPERKIAPLIIAGPCSVESEAQLETIARVLKRTGVTHLRGGAYKPRTSPYSFQGLGESGLELLHAIGKKHQLKIVSEIVSENDVALFERYVDMIQIGARNMQNYALLKAVGKSKLPVILKRGFASTIEEWLLSAEYILNEGNTDIILCERGIRNFDQSVPHTLDLNGMLKAKELTNLPIIIDPSHAAGDYRFVEALSLAGMAAGADGIMVEIHPEPSVALSDGAQSLKLDKFETLILKLNNLMENIH